MPCTVIVDNWYPSLRAFTRACAGVGREVRLLDLGRWDVSGAHYCAGLTEVRSFDRLLVGAPSGIATVREYCDSVGADSVLSNDEGVMVWLAENREAIGFARQLLMPSAEVLQSLRLKSAQIAVARAAGLDVLQTWMLTTPEDCDAVPCGGFPLALRPDCRGAVQPDFKVKVVHTPETLRFYVAAHDCRTSAIVAQPFMPAPNLIVHGARSLAGDVLAMDAFRVARKYRGMTLCIERCEFPVGVREACCRLAENAGLNGSFHIEFLLSVSGNSAYFLEVNARLGGTTDKVARLGFGESELTLRAYGLITGPRSRRASVRAGTRCVNKRTVLAHLRAALAGRLREVDYPAAGRFRNLVWDVGDLVCAKDSLLDWRDLRGTAWFYGLGALCRAVARVRYGLWRRNRVQAGLRRA